MPPLHAHISASDLTPLLSNPTLSTALDAFGHQSGIAQSLNKPITTTALLSSERALAEKHSLYCLLNPDGMNPGGDLVGYIKTGYKNLYLLDDLDMKAGLVECKECLSVLDFYVDERVQRGGWGRQVFEFMIADVVERRLLGEGRTAGEAAALLTYDRPSSKMVPFLQKLGLTDGYLQNNAYMTFRLFWEQRPKAPPKSRRK